MVILSKNFYILFPSSFLSLAVMHTPKNMLKLLDGSTIEIQKGPKSSRTLDLNLNKLLKNFPFLNIYFLLEKSWYSLVSCRSSEKLIPIGQRRKFTGLDLQFIGHLPISKVAQTLDMFTKCICASWVWNKFNVHLSPLKILPVQLFIFLLVTISLVLSG